MEPDKCRHSDSRTFMLKPPRFGGRKEAPCSAQTPETKVNEKTFPSIVINNRPHFRIKIFDLRFAICAPSISIKSPLLQASGHARAKNCDP